VHLTLCHICHLPFQVHFCRYLPVILSINNI
jgi:hypothetical protein